jgi:protein-tyrosine phosphatase
MPLSSLARPTRAIRVHTRRAGFTALMLLATALPAVSASGWTPGCDETREGKYFFEGLGGSATTPVRISLCADSGCATKREFATVTADSYSAPVTVETGRPYFLVERQRERRIIAARRLALAGAYNFRDLGGMETRDGRTVRWGKVFRSDVLAQLTAADYARLNSLGIGLVCDLRTREERRTAPTEWNSGSPMFVLAPVSEDERGNAVSGNLLQALQSGITVEEGRALFEKFYIERALQSAPKFGLVLRAIATTDRAAMFHCQGGRDRTGITAALLLQILGVSKETIVADYLLSTRYLNERPASAPAPGPPEQMQFAQRYADVIELQARYIEAIFAGIDRKYGAFDRYRREALGLTDDDVKMLKTKLLE